MRRAVVVDTSVLVELLGVPNKSQDPERIKEEFAGLIGRGHTILIPTAAVIETGNHIAQIGDGASRRRCAEGLVRVLSAACEQDGPFALLAASWDADFVLAICGGTPARPGLIEMATQAIGAGDLSILVEAEAYAARTANVSVKVWALDEGLLSYA